MTKRQQFDNGDVFHLPFAPLTDYKKDGASTISITEYRGTSQRYCRINGITDEGVHVRYLLFDVPVEAFISFDSFIFEDLPF